MNNAKPNRYMPMLLALSMVLGIVIGTFNTNHFSGNKLNIINGGNNRLSYMLNVINDQYVDKIDMDSLIDKVIPQILSTLDPHSTFLTKKEVEIGPNDLDSSFSGVGIEFTIRQDTLHVQNVISNGPAERAGIIAGDKIVSINHEAFVGKDITNEAAMEKLKGPKDTKVIIGVERFGQTKPLEFTITRGEIPQKSITAAYMIDANTGYIRIKSFAEQTWSEMLVAMASLSRQGFNNLIIDLRDNTGGYLQTAVQIANEFLPKNKVIVYTEGYKAKRKDYISDGHGSYQDIPLVVLINEASASASEILSGALQDNDRATIIGRRSFGKGLVQQPITFNDGSLLRLTIARYYTASGRCIQRPYTHDAAEYQKDLQTRYTSGEFFSQDSIKHTGPKYKTSMGRVVYGGGGITPDIFVAEDTTSMTSYYKQAAMSGLIIQFAYEYTDMNRSKLNVFKEMPELNTYLLRQNTVEQFANYADRHGLKRRNLMIQRSHSLLEHYVNGRIIYQIMGEQPYYKYINQFDPVIDTALKLFKENAAFPLLNNNKASKNKQVASVHKIGNVMYPYHPATFLA